MTPAPKNISWHSDKYRKWLRSLGESAAPAGKRIPKGDIVPAHQNLGYGKGGGKVSDTQCLPLYNDEHIASEHSKGDKSFWGSTDRAKLCLGYVCRYLDTKHNVDGYRLALELITQYMTERGIK